MQILDIISKEISNNILMYVIYFKKLLCYFTKRITDD